jgi:hypothetical protein
MKGKAPIFLIVSMVIGLTATFLYGDIEKTERIEKIVMFKNPDADNLMIIDNVFGDIRVTGYKGKEIQMRAIKTIEARSQEKVKEAEEEVFLDIVEENDLIEFYVDGPFRERGRRGVHWRGYRREGYKVRYDFEVKVPYGVNLELKTVNEGEIIVIGIKGDYIVNNVNGGIQMEDINGSGEVYSVNGDVIIDFMKNPQKNCRFGALNGEVRLYFLPKLSADFYLKTFNGEIFSDFPVHYLPVKPVKYEKEKKGLRVYKVNRMTAVRCGDGGPEIELDGFNGDMFILEK